jgi:hypothetical protein
MARGRIAAGIVLMVLGWPALVWPALVWPALVWPALVWPALVSPAFAADSGQVADPGQTAQSAPVAGQKLFGFYNPKTHTFTPSPAPPAASTAPPIVRSGTITINVNAKLDAIPSDAQVFAIVNASVNDATYQNGIGTRLTMKRSGNTATASITVPYIFQVMNASEKMTVSVEITSGAAPYPGSMLSTEIPLPANNAKTVVTLPQTF